MNASPNLNLSVVAKMRNLKVLKSAFVEWILHEHNVCQVHCMCSVTAESCMAIFVAAACEEAMNAAPVPFLRRLRSRSCADPDSMLFRQPRSEQVAWPKTLTLQLCVCEK